MRSSIVLTTAVICGVLAFGATLVIRAPRLPAQSQGGTSGRTFLASGVPPHDRETLRKMLRDDPDRPDPWLLYQLALREAWGGDLAESERRWIEAADAARHVEPDDRRRVGPAAIVRGECARHAGDAAGAAAAFREGLDIYERRMADGTRNSRWSFNAGWCCRRLGDAGGTAKYWSEVEEIITGNIDRQRADLLQLYTLASVRSMQGYNGQAIDTLAQMAGMGWRDRELLLNAEEFEGMRALPGFQHIVETMTYPRPGEAEPGTGNG